VTTGRAPVIAGGKAGQEHSPMHDPVYLDHNATTPVLPEVVDAMLPYLRQHFGNPSSGHVYGARARDAVARARAQVAALLGCDAAEVVFTSGGTESGNLAIRGITATCPRKRHVLTTAIEHPATAQPCAWLEQHGYSITRIGVDGDGRARVAAARGAIDGNTALVTVMHANNETGVLQPVAEIAALAHAAGAVVHTDAAQSLGKVPVRVGDLGVDLLSVAGHKLYAPKGVGALYVRRGLALVPFVLGAGHESGLRPGTENVASIVGLGAACAAVGADLDAAAARMRHLRDLLWERLAAGVGGLARNGHRELCLPNTLNVRFPDAAGSDVLDAAPEVAASTGSACHEGRAQPSAVIVAMGVPSLAALGSVRLTLGRGTTRDDVERAAAALVRAWRQVTGRDR
jgi:cysteine desulfurase